MLANRNWASDTILVSSYSEMSADLLQLHVEI